MVILAALEVHGAPSVNTKNVELPYSHGSFLCLHKSTHVQLHNMVIFNCHFSVCKQVYSSIEINSTTTSTTEDSNSTTAATTVLITEIFSTTFSSDSEDVSVHIQVHVIVGMI